MRRTHTLFLHLTILAVVLGLDLWSKEAIFRFLEAEIIARPGQTPILSSGPEYVIFPGFALEAAINLGAFNGMLSNYRWLLLTVSVVAAIATLVIALLPKRTPIGWTIALGLIAGGALGNFYDHVQFGAVRDFVKWYAGDFVWPNFNIADSGIVVGVFLIIFFEFRNARLEKQSRREADASLADQESPGQNSTA